MGYIYRITNLTNGKSYIGETKQVLVQSRWNNHIQSTKNHRGATALTAAFLKYGIENFKFEVVIVCFDDDRLYYEVEYIRKYNTLVPNGYNIVEGRLDISGFNSKNFNDFLKKKKKKFDTHNQKFKSFNVNIKERMEKSEKWKKALEEKRVGASGRVASENKHNDESKKKISESLKKYFSDTNNKTKINIEKHRKIMANHSGKTIEQYSLDNKFVAKFSSISAASRETGIHRYTIYNIVHGKKEGSFIWRFCEAAHK